MEWADGRRIELRDKATSAVSPKNGAAGTEHIDIGRQYIKHSVGDRPVLHWPVEAQHVVFLGALLAFVFPRIVCRVEKGKV